MHQSLGTIPDQIDITLFDQSNTKSIIVKYGYITLHHVDSIRIYHVILEHLLGGRQKLFGIITVNDHDPNDAKRIMLVDSTSLVNEYSINEILKMDTINVGGILVYKINM